jgi:hypothetical protein
MRRQDTFDHRSVGPQPEIAFALGHIECPRAHLRRAEAAPARLDKLGSHWFERSTAHTDTPNQR